MYCQDISEILNFGPVLRIQTILIRILLFTLIKIRLFYTDLNAYCFERDNVQISKRYQYFLYNLTEFSL
jgi:hypothetical protein